MKHFAGKRSGLYVILSGIIGVVSSDSSGDLLLATPWKSDSLTYNGWKL